VPRAFAAIDEEHEIGFAGRVIDWFAQEAGIDGCLGDIEALVADAEKHLNVRRMAGLNSFHDVRPD
jgi:hypothetical protein